MFEKASPFFSTFFDLFLSPMESIECLIERVHRNAISLNDEI